MAQQIYGNIVDVFTQQIFYGMIAIEDGRISSIQTLEASQANIQSAPFLLPGFIDSHVHIESSMLVPSEFAKIAVVHGTVATISDPHEIANVCGMQGVEFMIANGKTVPFKFHFGAPSCVPATHFETAGATLTVKEVTALLQMDEISYLSEMMNFPGVLAALPEVMEKIEAARQLGKPVDGHAPGLSGKAAKQYIEAGISTDHECFTIEEALEKLQYGMKILIREGSAAKNFEALIDLLNDYPDDIMFCSDDKHPDSLVSGHINQLCERAVAKGINIFNVIKAACVNPVLHYKMKVGLLREGDAADFIMMDDLVSFKVNATYIGGRLVASKGQSLIETTPAGIINQFNCVPQTPGAFTIHFSGEKEIAVIEALEGQLITNKIIWPPTVSGNEITVDVDSDILKIAVVNRYQVAPVAKAFIKNFGLKQGAIASTVAHDSHNIIAVGTDDESICKAVNLVIASTGGISCVGNNLEMILPLPVGGLMSNDDGYKVAAAYTAIDKNVKEILGSTLAAPFMTLSFMALLVIPHLKLSDLGLFDGDHFSFIYSPPQ